MSAVKAAFENQQMPASKAALWITRDRNQPILQVKYRPYCSKILLPMQTLNVGAGRSDEEYKAAEEQRRAELRDNSQTDASYFFIAAGLAALGTGLLPLRLNVAVIVGVLDLMNLYGREWLHFHPLMAYAAPLLWVAILGGLGVAARNGYRWAFLAGVVLYGADMIALGITFSWLAIGIHGFFVFRWFQGQRALQELKDSIRLSASAARSA